MAITITNDSASIGSTEYFLFGDSTTASYQTTDAVLQVFIDFVNMAAGDEYLVTIYEGAEGTNARTLYKATFVGAQTELWSSPAFIVGNKYEVSVDKIAGTDRTILWSLRTIT